MRNAKEEEMKLPNNNSYLYSPEPCFFSRPFVRLWTWEWNPSFSYHIQGWEGYHWWKNDCQQAVACVFTQLLHHVWLCDPKDCKPTWLLCPWDFPAKNTAVGYHPFSRGSSRPRDRTHISCTAGKVLHHLNHLGSSYEVASLCQVLFGLQKYKGEHSTALTLSDPGVYCGD